MKVDQHTDRKEKTELSVQQRKQIEHELIGHIIPHNGHTIFEIEIETGLIKEAEYMTDLTFIIGQDVNKRILTREGCFYVSALNKKSALRKYNKGANGSKPKSTEPIKFY